MDVSWNTRELSSRIQELPAELLNLLQHGNDTEYLRALTHLALNKRYTDLVTIYCDPLLAHCCASFPQLGDDHGAALAAYARVLPFAPHLAECAEQYLASRQLEYPQSLDDAIAVEYLLSLYRLLRFDHATFSPFVPFPRVEAFLSYQSACVRYLAVRTLCVYLHAADAATERMLEQYVPEGQAEGPWEGKSIDYRFLSLWEEERMKDVHEKIAIARIARNTEQVSLHRVITANSLHPATALVGGVLLPRSSNPESSSREPTHRLVETPTTMSNLHEFAKGLSSSQPLLLTGLAGSGKTLIVRHVARQLNKEDNMVTLHLNEQSDAKLLIGMYTTGSTPGSFSWQPGVLTRAVQEGRWVFIEDIDRAPNEILSTMLPLIERRELMIPSRGQTIPAARGFRVIATLRTVLNPNGEESKPAISMVGARLWNITHLRMPPTNELRSVIVGLYPALSEYALQFITVFEQLQHLNRQSALTSRSKTGIMRAPTSRDLLKWSSRVMSLVAGRDTFNDGDHDEIFLDAVDCFAGSLPDSIVSEALTSCIAQYLQIDPQRKEHLLRVRHVLYEENRQQLRIGRNTFNRQQQGGLVRQSGRAFSTNDHTLRMLDRVGKAVNGREPLLLVGETGVGKTTSVQHLADRLGKKLVPFNLSQQSESGDLLGGFKPVNVRSIVVPLKEEFDDLFSASFSAKRNQDFLKMLGKFFANGQWTRVCRLWKEALGMVEKQRLASSQAGSDSPARPGSKPHKKRRVESAMSPAINDRWDKFAENVKSLDARLSASSESSNFAFAFVEGNIVKAVRNGDWVLLDEINLASADTLEALADLFDASSPSLMLSEAGSVERIHAHPDFRVFAAMNPATDVGKKDLPSGIRSRFTELYVESPDRDFKSLQDIVRAYIGKEATLDPAVVVDVSTLHRKVQELAEQNLLVDGSGQKPHFSLRTLTRALTYAKDVSTLCSLRRALFEGFQMSFLTLLDKESESRLYPLLQQHLLPKKAASELKKAFKMPSDGHQYVREGQYWLRQGAFPIEDQPHYIITPFIRRNLDNLIRAASTRRSPVLIQGPTSAGKTSMIEYLAKKSGNKFVRINNHEHTDLQEYLGTYVSINGKLQFQEGILVKALREGHWIVLDELNLAPTDVLEALNRLLDDNRELLIPETQETVRPHENFMLFATQNPAGLYGGRKVLSRAFRNRFLELHFDDIPIDELHEILHRRTQIPDSWCKRIVNVYRELSVLRQENRLFEQKSFATLRDLFRWAMREAVTVQDLAVNGFFLLAERVRKPEEREAVKKVIESVLSKGGPKVTIRENDLYSEQGSPELRRYFSQGQSKGLVWTSAMRRLYVLVARAIDANEAVLLVGETGCGKTTVCQMLADAAVTNLNIVNAHQNTETGDLIGAQRPVRNRAAIEQELRQKLSSLHHAEINALQGEQGIEKLLHAYDRAVKVRSDDKVTLLDDVHAAIQIDRTRLKALFEWSDGSLVHAMKTGQYFLLDEINLADDAVLERLNSVLEPQRSILLAEKGSLDSFVTAKKGFQFLASMNPGGDYGKRELSPALRNRFTEIWVPALSDLDDVLQIVRSKLRREAVDYAPALVSFAQWFNERFNTSAASSISIRDTLAWIEFINRDKTGDVVFAIVHGAAMVYIDTLGANPAALLAINPANIEPERRQCLVKLGEFLKADAAATYDRPVEVGTSSTRLSLGPFSLPIISSPQKETDKEDADFTFEAPTTRSNAMRVVRALQLSKPVLLEGNPGVGKTTLVSALAKTTGTPLTRINLSEQTDLMDLFGSDVPVEGAEAGAFAWRDAPFLRAMKQGEWVLLDEMNLASQSVLEGLNACLDHRGEVYIAELDQTFSRHPEFRLFAAQNPHHQGGGRKGLPASFVNRFTVVYADVLRRRDLVLICQRTFKQINVNKLESVVEFVDRLDQEVAQQRKIGSVGGPWEVNLRDTLRWLTLVASQEGLLKAGDVYDFLSPLLQQRFRTVKDRSFVSDLFCSVMQYTPYARSLFHNLSYSSFQVGLGLLERRLLTSSLDEVSNHPDFKPHLPILESMMVCIQKQWPVLLVGPSGSGKTVLIEKLASLAGRPLTTLAMNADIDSMDLVGGYEQSDPQREVIQYLDKLTVTVKQLLIESLTEKQQGSHTLREILNLCSSAEAVSGTRSKDVLLQISRALQTLLGGKTPFGVQILYEECAQLAAKPVSIDRAQFEWMDGILVKALEQGQWLVLDNANLCSPAVLDRLNSLLEPNGSLIVNEHTDANGQARTIKPHPDFRVFLTMDPKYGELSRALRNRAVELFLLSPERTADSLSAGALSLSTESNLHRLRNTSALAHQNLGSAQLSAVMDVAVDHFAEKDLSLLPSFAAQVQSGLYGLQTGDVEESLQKLSTVVQFNHGQGFKTQEMVEELVGSQLPTDFTLVQTIHPLNNEALASFNSSMATYYARIFELEWDLSTMQRALAVVENIDVARKDMTRLQRSARALQVPNAAKDSTAGAFHCLAGMMNAVREWCKAMISRKGRNLNDMDTIDELVRLRRFWWDLFHLLNSANFDEAVFQAYLDIGRSLFHGRMRAPLSQILGDSVVTALSTFRSKNELTNGPSMVALWSALKPQTPRTFSQLQDLLRLEKLADKFDAYAQRFEGPLEDSMKLQQSFSNALQIMRKGTDEASTLLWDLNEVMSSIDLGDAGEDIVPPHFQRQFEGICQIFDLLALRRPDLSTEAAPPLATALALRSTRYGRQEDTSPKQTPSLQLLGGYIGFNGNEQGPVVLGNDLPLSVASQLAQTNTVPLSRLDLLHTELTCLGDLIASHAQLLGADQIVFLRNLLYQLLEDVFGSSGSCLFSVDEGASTEKKTVDEVALSDPHLAPVDPSNKLLQNVQQSLLLPVHFYLIQPQSSHPQDRPDVLAMAANAWLAFALACIQLYVPNQPFDPALKPLVERDMFRKRQDELSARLSSLETFEALFTGQSSTSRILLTQMDLKRMGPEPSAPEIARPPQSEIMQLQGDFHALFRTIAPLQQTSQEKLCSFAQDSTLRQNVAHIKRRLSEGYRAYDDITAPAVGFLHCLEIGFTLATLATAPVSESSVVVSQVNRMTPLLGAKPKDWATGAAVIGMANTTESVRLRLHGLSSYALLRSIQSSDGMTGAAVDVVYGMFDDFYAQWKHELETNQEKAAARSSLYTFRGGDDVEDEASAEEYAALFPEYDAEQEEKSAKDLVRQRLHDWAPQIADVQGDICATTDSQDQRVLKLVNSAASVLNIRSLSTLSTEASKATPMLIMLLQEKTNLVTGISTSPQRYNIYTDPNITETRSLIDLVRKVQARFRVLREAWPEHATLHDVLRVCDELLAFQHTEPVAKLLTKVEKLHEYVHEWQRVASREYTAASLYDNITDLIVHWRQLELSTWARLLDIEVIKCNEDAKTWWFIAYENIVKVPLMLQREEVEMRTHVTELLKTLHSFFFNTGLGQFSERLHMLNVFRQYLKLRIATVPALQTVHDGLSNFIAYMSHFERPVASAIINGHNGRKGRQALEKVMKNIIQLASWKDRNVDALKQSAKASHRKLFAVIRKFRDLLAQPVEGIVRAPIPDAIADAISDNNVQLARITAASAQEALALCAQHVTSWNDRPARFRNIPVTLSVMQSKGQIKPDSINGTTELQTWLTDTESLAAQLRKATPTVLTDENKETVKHLKTRKRKLFADVLKELRNMGFKSNLSSDVLAAQGSLQAVLATLPDPAHVNHAKLGAAQHCLDQLLQIMPDVREALREHSDDLTSAEVARSVALLESMLQTITQQRVALHVANTNKRSLDDAVAEIQNLWGNGSLERVFASFEKGYTTQAATEILPALIRASAHIVSSQIGLGKLDCDSVVEELRQKAGQFEDLRSQSRSLVKLPSGLSSNTHTHVTKRGELMLRDLQSSLSSTTKRYPYLTPVLDELATWATVDTDRKASNGDIDGHNSVQLDSYSQGVFDFIDTILGSIQDVEEPLSKLPLSYDDPAWLLQEGSCLSSALRALRTQHITGKLDALLAQLRDLDDSHDSLSVAGALFHNFMPVIQQYQAIIKYLSERLAKLHESVCSMSHRLAKIFVQLAKEGFCTPSEKTSGKDNQDDKLEGGTGLGEGEGAEDISKDIQDDEDLTELAQEPQKADNQDGIEDEKDAVDMADQEMEGQTEDKEENGKDEGEGSGDEDEDEDMEEEAGDVDDLGPSTVDEKMWDDGGKEADKDKEAENAKGTEDKDDITAAEGQEQNKPEGDKEEASDEDAEEEMGAEESENVGMDEVEKADPHMQEQENLDLPDEINMDGENKEDDESDLEDFGDGDAMDQDIPDVPEEEQAEEGDVGTPTAEEDTHEEANAKDEHPPEVIDENELEKTQDAGETAEEEEVGIEEEDTLLQDQTKNDDVTEDVAQSEAQGTGLNQEQVRDEQNQANSGAAQQEEGTEGDATEQQQAAGAKGQRGQAQQDKPSQGDNENAEENKEALPFKKIGDALEKWYRQQKQIQEAQEKGENEPQQQQDADMADAEFEHLPDETTEADAQALGAAKEEQATAIDEDLGQPTNENEDRERFPLDKQELDNQDRQDQDVEMEEAEIDPKQRSTDAEGRPNAFVGESRDEQMDIDNAREQPKEESPNVEEVDTQLTSTHLDVSPSQLSHEEARALWSAHESSIRTLSLVLTEHLRLILSPTQATKMRGDFRTGKRLNIKRIIPYIASQYKRDKIWMRRSVPSKRSYQIMLAIDDSKSMAEGNSSELAFETLALVAKSLSMLEAGELCIAGFGEDVQVAHEFATPFTSDSGAEVVRRFSFDQTRTNVRRLIEKSLELFRAARIRASSSAAELWQLQLIISDGVCEDHPTIRRLVRQAQEERIMIVFVIVDAAAAASKSGKGGGNSILDLKTAEFGKDEATGEMRVRTVKYLDTFPFGYYLVVRDVNELPGVLAGALRQWFAEVVETGGQ